MHRPAHLQADPIPWLLERENPSARYLTLRYLLDRPEEDAEVAATRAAILGAEPAASILAAQWPQGYWVKPDRGYSPKYRATVWQLLFLAQLGAPPEARIRRACEFVWIHSRGADGLFAPHQRPALRDLGLLNGALIWALAHFGYAADPRMERLVGALTALPLSRLLSPEAVPAVVWLLRGLQSLPQVPPSLASFCHRALDFLADCLPPPADSLWWSLTFPLTDVIDVVEVVGVLLGQRRDDPRVAATLERVWERQERGRWPLERAPGKTWGTFGNVGEANKWVTIRVLRMVGLAHGRPHGQKETRTQEG